MTIFLSDFHCMNERIDSNKNPHKVNVLFHIVKMCASHKKIQYNQH
jgi:hypothetical protein